MNILILDRDRYDEITKPYTGIRTLEPNMERVIDLGAFKYPDGSYWVFKNVLTNENGTMTEMQMKRIMLKAWNNEYDEWVPPEPEVA